MLLAAGSVYSQNKEALAKSDSLFAAGVDLYNAGKYNEAIPLFTESDKIDKAELDSTSNRRDYSAMWLASCYYKTGDEEEAKNWDNHYMAPPIDRRLTIVSDSLANIGTKYANDGNYEEAIFYLQQCGEIEKSVAGENSYWHANTIGAISYYHSFLGNYEEAIRFGTEALAIKEKVLSKENVECATLLVNLSYYNANIGNYEEAIRLATEALEIYKKTLGKEHPNYATSLNYLATYNYYLDNYAEAIRLGTEALGIREKTLGKGDPDYVTSLINLAIYNYYLGNYAEAIRLRTEALEIQEIALGKEHPDYAASLHDLASYNYHLGNYKEAIQLETETLEIRKKTLGKEHPDYVASLNDLAVYNANVGNYEEAIRLGKEVLEIREKILGKEHPVYAQLLSNLASYNYYMSNYKEAIRLETEALEILEKTLGKEHHKYTTSLSNLAFYNSDLGNYAEAIRLETEVLEIQEETLGEEHPDYILSLNNLAHYNSSLGNYAEAIRIGSKALEIIEKTSGREHPDYATSLSNLANYNSEIGNYAQAIRLETEALEIREKILGKEHPDYATSLNNLASCNYYMGNFEEAIRIGTKALEIKEKTLGKEHPNYATSLNNLANYNSSLGNYTEAIRLETEALEIKEKTLGKEHPDYATSLNGLALYNSDLGNYAEAIRFEMEALEIIGKTLGKEHPNYARSLSNLAIYNSDLGNYVEAIRLVTEAIDIIEKTLGKEHPIYANSLNNLASYNYDFGNYAEAKRLGTKALEIIEKSLGKEHPKYAILLSNLANYNASLGNYVEAIRFGTEALEIREKTLGKEHPDYANSLGGMVVYNFANGLYQEASEYAIATTQTLSRIVCSTFSDLTSDERTMFWDKYNDWFETTLPYYAFYIQTDSLTTSAYDGTLLSKGLLLNSELEMNKLLLESGDTIVVKKYQELRSNRAMLNKMQEKGWSDLGLVTDSLLRERQKAALIARTDSLRRVLNVQEQELVQQSKVYGDYTKNLSIGWRDVQAKLTDKDAAIEFLYFGAKNDSVMYAALTLTKEDAVPHLVPLFEEKQLKSINKKEYYSTSQLSDLIWAPLSEVLKDKENVYFAPAGQLHNLPIETIPCYDGEGLMSERWNLYRLTSTRQLALIKEENEMKEAYVYGGLSYDMEVADVVANASKYDSGERGADWETVNIARVLQLKREAGGQVLDPLPGTKVEAQNIDRSLKELDVHSTLLTDTLGTEASFKALSGSRPNVLHIATHGFYWTESEAKQSDLSIMSIMNDDTQSKYVEDKALTRSALFLAGAENALEGGELPEGVDDGILTAKEISTLDLRGLDLVVLSACQTGLGEITGDGVFGLQRGFKKAGANTMLMSLWKVNDAATRMLMEQFYKGLLNKKTKLQALKEAQEYVRDYKEEKTVSMNDNLTPSQKRRMEREGVSTESKTETQIVQPYESPLYWAAFILLDAID